MMKINFSHTAQNDLDQIEYYNQKGDIVKKYPLSELENWIDEHGVNPDNISVDKYIDDNWASVTECFYIARNPSGFKSANHEQETRGVW